MTKAWLVLLRVERAEQLGYYIEAVPPVCSLSLNLQLQWKSIHCGYVPDEEPAPPPKKGLMIEPQVDPIKAEQMFT